LSFFFPLVQRYIFRIGRKHKYSEIRNQSLLADDQGIFDQYNELVLNFGYIAFFCSAFPVAALACYINNVFELKVDAYNYLYQTKRTHYEGARNIGVWMKIMEIISYIGVVTNVSIIAFTDRSQLYWDTYNALLIAFLLENVILFLKWYLSHVIDDVPQETKYLISLLNFFKLNRSLLEKGQKFKRNKKNRRSLVVLEGFGNSSSDIV